MKTILLIGRIHAVPVEQSQFGTESSFDVAGTTSNMPSDDRLDIREKVVMDKLPASVLSSFDEAARTQTIASDIGEYKAEDS